MFLVTGITGKVGGATARHLLAQGKKVRALVRDRAKAASWTDQGVELVDGDWNDAAAIERALKGVEGAFVMLPSVWAPSPDFNEAKGVIANYVEALTRAAPPRVVALSSMGANRTRGLGMITALSLLEQGFRDPLVQPLPRRVPNPTRNPPATITHQEEEISIAGSEPPASRYRTGAVTKPRTNAPRQPISSACGGSAPPTMPLIPAIRPVKSHKTAAERPTKEPPTAAEIGVKCSITTVYDLFLAAN